MKEDVKLLQEEYNRIWNILLEYNREYKEIADIIIPPYSRLEFNYDEYHLGHKLVREEMERRGKSTWPLYCQLRNLKIKLNQFRMRDWYYYTPKI